MSPTWHFPHGLRKAFYADGPAANRHVTVLTAHAGPAMAIGSLAIRKRTTRTDMGVGELSLGGRCGFGPAHRPWPAGSARRSTVGCPVLPDSTAGDSPASAHVHTTRSPPPWPWTPHWGPPLKPTEDLRPGTTPARSG